MSVLALIFLWSDGINSADELTPIAVSLSNQDFHESLQPKAFKEEVLFGTEGFFGGAADSFVDFPPSLPCAGLS